jgi:hypothetical protein
MQMKLTSAVRAVFLVASVVPLAAQVKEHPIPRIVEKDGRYALFVDDAPYLMLDAQVHNSSSWPAELPKVAGALNPAYIGNEIQPRSLAYCSRVRLSETALCPFASPCSIA